MHTKQYLRRQEEVEMKGKRRNTQLTKPTTRSTKRQTDRRTDGRSDQLTNQTRICRDPEHQRQKQIYPTALFFARRPRNWQPSVSAHQQPAPRHFSHSAKRPPNTMMFFFHLFLSLLLPLLFFCLGPGYCCRCCCCFGLFTSFSCFLFRGLRS